MSTMALPDDASMSTERRTVRRIVAISAVLGGACAAAMLVHSGPGAAASSILGTVVGIGNLVAIAGLIDRLMSQQADKARASALLLLKTLALIAFTGLVVTRPWASGPGFIAGFTAVVFAITVGGLWGADPPRADDADKKED